MGAILGRVCVIVIVGVVATILGLNSIFDEQTGQIDGGRAFVSLILQTVIGAVFFMVFFRVGFWRGVLEYIVIGIAVGVVLGLIAGVLFRTYYSIFG